eukprot:3155906-Prymnesium_polylepis.1
MGHAPSAKRRECHGLRTSLPALATASGAGVAAACGDADFEFGLGGFGDPGRGELGRPPRGEAARPPRGEAARTLDSLLGGDGVRLGAALGRGELRGSRTSKGVREDARGVASGWDTCASGRAGRRTSHASRRFRASWRSLPSPACLHRRSSCCL